jgi:hypothetical protein
MPVMSVVRSTKDAETRPAVTLIRAITALDSMMVKWKKCDAIAVLQRLIFQMQLTVSVVQKQS